MEPIISPWVVYMIDVANSVQNISQLVMFLSLVIATYLGIATLIDDDFSYNALDECLGVDKEEKWKKHTERKSRRTKWFKVSIITMVVSGVVTVLVPNKETCLQMLAVSYITPDNINITQEALIDFVSKLREAVKAAK